MVGFRSALAIEVSLVTSAATRFWGILASILTVSLSVQCAELSKADLNFFETKIRPIFVERCYQCHSHQSEKLRGQLLLDTREGVLKGGKTGPAIVPGDPDKSLLIQAVRYTNEDLQMPPKGEKLSTTQVTDLETWVKIGAPDPRTHVTVAAATTKNWADPTRDHWAFQPVKKPPVPQVSDPAWIANPVDAFILAKLEQNGMKPSPRADKRTLLRRATFDLIGLPLKPEEVKAFLEDDSADAFAKVIDRLLDAKQYGERWARFWLDTARYSDTKGEVKKKKEDPHYPFAWTYRDYVIQSFNSDKPYSRFIIEQLAADKLPNLNDRTTLAALGLLTLGDRFNNNANDIINDQIDVVTKGFLGLTVSCARCHDHKFDPIPMRDYYSLHGIFASCREPAELPVIAAAAKPSDYTDYQNRRTALERQLKELESKPKKGQKRPRKELQKEIGEIKNTLARLELTHPGAPVRATALEDKPKPADSRVFIRGEAENKGEVAPRRFLEVLSGPKRQLFRYGSGRVELANAIASTNNPLTARVMVNRIWLHHFGEGIVTTPDDFGTQSAPPSHPELLDFLASRFMEEGWSIKGMHRLMMLSSTYQQSSETNPRFAQTDPNNRLLWRANIRRLEFEPLRDSLLAIGGKLDLTVGGKPVDLTSEPYSTRRTVYGYIDRSNLPELFNHFDFANPDLTTGKRYQTTVPQQTLFLMNSPLVVEQAKNLVARPDFHSTSDDTARIELLYELIYQRPPKPEEIELAEEFLDEGPSSERVTFTPVDVLKEKRARRLAAGRQGKAAQFTPRPPLSRWEEYAHALLQANEASYIN